jgi:hypothetical protein
MLDVHLLRKIPSSTPMPDPTYHLSHTRTDLDLRLDVEHRHRIVALDIRVRLTAFDRKPTRTCS